MFCNYFSRPRSKYLLFDRYKMTPELVIGVSLRGHQGVVKGSSGVVEELLGDIKWVSGCRQGIKEFLGYRRCRGLVHCIKMLESHRKHVISPTPLLST